MGKDQDVRTGTDRGALRIRQAEAGDVDAIRRCVDAAFAPYTAAIGQEPAPMRANFDAVVAQDRVLVADMPDGGVAGVVTARLAEPETLEIDILAVPPECQGTGIARALMQACEMEAGEQGATTVVLYTNEVMVRALGFYRRLGYAETKRVVEDGYRRVYFRKDL